MPGNGRVQLPFPAHIVVGDEALAPILFAQRVRTLEAHLRRWQVDAVRKAHVFDKGLLRHGVGRIEKAAIVDPVSTKSVDPTERVDQDEDDVSRATIVTAPCAGQNEGDQAQAEGPTTSPAFITSFGASSAAGS